MVYQGLLNDEWSSAFSIGTFNKDRTEFKVGKNFNIVAFISKIFLASKDKLYILLSHGLGQGEIRICLFGINFCF